MHKAYFYALTIIGLCLAQANAAIAKNYDPPTESITAFPTSPPADDTTYSLPMVPAGSYLQHCSYNFIQYDKESGIMKAVCGPQKRTVSITIEDIATCLHSQLDIRWSNSRNLHCKPKYPAHSKMLGDQSIPNGPYLEYCSGVILDQESRTLYASCPRNNDYNVSAINLDDCTNKQSIINQNGSLACAATEKTPLPTVPLGSYLNNCLALKTNIDATGNLTSLCHQALYHKDEMNCELNASSCPPRRGPVVVHDVFDRITFDATLCQNQGLNICLTPEHHFFCSRSLVDELFYNLVPSKTVPAGSYLQFCNHIFYDEEHDTLNAACAINNKQEAILSSLPMKDDNVFDINNYYWAKCGRLMESYLGCNEAPASAFFTAHRQTASTIINASQCVDPDSGVSRVTVDKNGKLTCPMSEDFEDKYFNLAITCGGPVSQPEPPVQPRTPTYNEFLAGTIASTVALTAVVAVQALIAYFVYRIYFPERPSGYDKM